MAICCRAARRTGAATWLINTGWTGGAYGVGKRIDIASTRRLVAAALSGELDDAPMRIDPHFGFAVPLAVEGAAPKRRSIRAPAGTMRPPMHAAAHQSGRMFEANLRKFETQGAVAACGSNLELDISVLRGRLGCVSSPHGEPVEPRGRGTVNSG